MTKAILFDATICIGCGACSSACKETHNLQGETNPASLGPDTYTIVKKMDGLFVRNFCRHCLKPSCASACPVSALHKTPVGAVIYDKNKCIGCRYCFVACPYGIPRYEWSKNRPLVKKCNFCFERIEKGAEPACAEICPTGATKFGEREEMLKEARARINSSRSYFNHIFGERELGGSSLLFIADRDLRKLGLKFPRSEEPFAELTKPVMHAVPFVAFGVGAFLTLMWGLFKRKERLSAEREKNNEK